MPRALKQEAPHIQPAEPHSNQLSVSEVKPWNYERREFEIIKGTPRPMDQVRAFRVNVDGSMYDIQVTARGYLRDYVEDDRHYQWAYTVAVFGWAAQMSTSAGRIYRFTSEHLFAPMIANKLDIHPSVADAIVTVMRQFDHSGVTCCELDSRHVDFFQSVGGE